MAATVLGGVIEFLTNLGIYDVLLPFLLVFTIVYAILEKTKVLGTEKVGGEVYARKNLNAMSAFAIGFLVLASSRLVEAITSISSNVVLLILLGVFFLMLVAVFYSEEEIKKGGLHEKWAKVTFGLVMLIGMGIIFLNALKTEGGSTWLDVFWNWLSSFYTSSAVASIILIVIIIGFIAYVTRDK